MAKKEKLSVESYKGVRDFYPEEWAFINYFFATCRNFLHTVGYVEYHASILEPAELYRGKTSEEIVNEQTYTFLDRGGREVTLRPEMTPTVARMVAARRREFGFPLRLYSIPNVFRYERPQRGRLREHWQLNADLFGSSSPAADGEIIAVAYGLMGAFGATESDFTIKVASREALEALSGELDLSPARARALRALLDRRAKIPPADFENGLKELGVPPERLEGMQAPPEIAETIQQLKKSGIDNVTYAPEVVRGFDYYTGMVFEVFDTHPKNNRALFGGGRYDNLLSLFGDEKVPAVGIALGDVALRDFLEVRGILPAYRSPTHVYLATPSPTLAYQLQALAGKLRQHGVNVAIDFGERKLADQIKAAVKNKIPYLMVVGEDELRSGHFVVRDLAAGEEKSLSKEELAQFFLNL
jgi:histidyl-tRNA synthetase